MPNQERIAAIALAASLISGICLAQEAGPNRLPDAPAATQHATAKPERTITANPIELINGRSLFFPDIAHTKGPLSPRRKFNLFIYNSTSGSALMKAAAGAGISQARDSYSGYGQGGSGYAKRFGASMTTNASANFFGAFMLASLLHQDPRFFVKDNLSVGGTVKYAAWCLLYTHVDSGGTAINYSGLIGPLAAETLADTYRPEADRNAAKTFERYGSDLAIRFGGNVFRQYWPKLFKKLRPVIPLPDGS